MRILYHHRTQGRGAEGLHIWKIAQALTELGHEVVIVSPPGIEVAAAVAAGATVSAAKGSARKSSLLKWFSAKMPGMVFELAEILYNIPAYFRLRRILATQHFDLVYERYAFYLVAGALAAWRSNTAFVLEANEINGIELRNRPQHLPSLCGRFERYLFQHCSAIHTVSSYLAKGIVASGVPPERVHVAPNAFDMRALQGLRAKDELRAQLGLAPGPVIGFAGWFSHWDRLDFLIEVFATLSTTPTSPQLLLIGDGPMVNDLKSQAQALGVDKRVTFTGPVARSDIYNYLSLIDIAVLPHSNNFGSPVVMFEFMGLKIPVVAPRLPPILDVHRDRETASLFDPLNAQQCRSAIDELLSDHEAAKAMAVRAHQQLLQAHTWQRNAQRILDSLPPSSKT